MTTLGDYTAGAPKILLIGPSGSGKTCLATTLGARATVIDLNNGLISAKLLKDKWHDARAKCEVKPCWGGASPLVIWNKAVSYITGEVKSPTREALVIDGLSDLAEVSLGSVLMPAGKWEVGSGALKNITMAEWGVAIAQLERLLWNLRALSVPLVLIGHTKTTEQDGTEREAVACYGKELPRKFAAAFDEVWYAKVEGWGEKRQWVVQTVSSSGVICKSRRQLPDKTLMDVGMEKMMEMIGWKWK